MKTHGRPRPALVPLVACVACAACVACDGRTPAGGRGAGGALARRDGPSLAVFDLSVGVPETEGTNLLGLGARRGSFDDLVAAIDDASRDRDTRGVYVRFGTASIGIARATEIGDAFGALRASGKPVYCHAENLSNATLYAAARACSRIFLAPAGGVESVGIAAQIVYLRKLLVDELKLSVDILQVGKFKGAEEPLTRDGPSNEARASLEGTLADLRATWLDGITKGRGKPEVAQAAEDGPYAPPMAVARGLVDEIAHADDAREAARKAAGAVRDVTRFGPGAAGEGSDMASVVKALAGEGTWEAPIALVRAVGSISLAGAGGLFGSGGGITEHELGRVLARLEKDDAVKAVVLRIDSPGGSALASDMIWHALMRVRKKKPVVVSIGEMAASGGYYLACAGTTVFAEPTSIVGSIGVVGGKVGLGSSLERFGVHSETFSAKPGDPAAANRAAYLSTFTPWDPATRARVLESMKGVYDLFLSRISEGRKLTTEKIAASAEGRIFSGREGKERGLVDELGGLGAALARAKDLAHVGPDASVAVVGHRPTFLDAIFGGGRDDGDEEHASGAPDAAVVAALSRIAPAVVPFAVSFAPLAFGESTLAAVPYALDVR